MSVLYVFQATRCCVPINDADTFRVRNKRRIEPDDIINADFPNIN